MGELTGLGEGLNLGLKQLQQSQVTADEIRRKRDYLNLQQQYLQLGQDKWDTQKQKENIEIQSLQNKLNAQQRVINQQEIAQGLMGVREGNVAILNNSIKSNEGINKALGTLGVSFVKNTGDYTENSLKTFKGFNNDVLKNPNNYMVASDSQGNMQILSVRSLAIMTGATLANASLQTQVSQMDAIYAQEAAKLAEQQALNEQQLAEPTRSKQLANSAFNEQNLNKLVLDRGQAGLVGADTSFYDQLQQSTSLDDLVKLGFKESKLVKSGSQEAQAMADKYRQILESEANKPLYFKDLKREDQSRLSNWYGKSFETAQKAIDKENKKFQVMDNLVQAVQGVNNLTDTTIPAFKNLLLEAKSYFGNSFNEDDLKDIKVKQFLKETMDIIIRLRTGAAINKDEMAYYKAMISDLNRNKSYILAGLKAQLLSNIRSLEHIQSTYGDKFDFLAGNYMKGYKDFLTMIDEKPEPKKSPNNVKFNPDALKGQGTQAQQAPTQSSSIQAEKNFLADFNEWKKNNRK